MGVNCHHQVFLWKSMRLIQREGQHIFSKPFDVPGVVIPSILGLELPPKVDASSTSSSAGSAARGRGGAGDAIPVEDASSSRGKEDSQV